MSGLKIKDAPLLQTLDGSEKIPTGGKGNKSVTTETIAEFVKTNKNLATVDYVDSGVSDVSLVIDAHKDNSSNPHEVTKDQVGLGNVDNTSDINKPVSNATSIVLGIKADKETVYTKIETNNLISPISQSVQALNDAGGLKQYDRRYKFNAAYATSIGGYPLHTELLLENGDIVKSTVANNTVNPNVNMTGWVLVNSDSQIKTWSGETQEEVNEFNFKQLRSYITASNLIATDQNIIDEFISKNKDVLVVDKKLTLSDSMVIDNRLSGKKIVFTPSGLVTWENGLSFVSTAKKALIKFDDNLSDFSIYDPVCDGNKANTTSDVGNACHGISFSKLLMFNNVNIYNPICRNNRGSGIGYNSGGMKVFNAVTFGNLWHGQGGAYDTGDIVHVINSINYDNGAYGFDFSRGNFIHDGLLYCKGNQQGGAKASVGCKSVIADSVYLEGNLGSSFRTTGEALDLNINIKSLIIKNHLGTEDIISIATGNIISIDYINVTGSTTNTGVRIGDCSVFSSKLLCIQEMQGRGAYIRNCVANIAVIKTKNTPRSALVVDAGAILNSDVIFIENSNTEVGSPDLYGLISTQASVINVAILKHVGVGNRAITCTFGAKLYAGLHNIGSLEPSNTIDTSSTGSTYKTNSSSGVVVDSYETIQASGTGSQTSFTLNLINPLTSVGGGVYVATVYGNSTDANATPFTVYQVSPTLVRVRFTTAPPAGTNNLTFNVNVKLEKAIR